MPEATTEFRHGPCGDVLLNETELSWHNSVMNYYCDMCEDFYWGCVYGDECPNGCSERYDDDECSDGVGINYYSFKPAPEFFGGTDSPYHIGFELEIGTNNLNATRIYNYCANKRLTSGHERLFYCKEDGSVDGFEIVSHPMTPEFFRSVDWEDFFDMLRIEYGEPYGKEENHGHGLHVHVSRTAFPRRSTMARWLYLLNRNQEPVQRVSRRDSDWARFLAFPVTMTLDSNVDATLYYATRDRLAKKLYPDMDTDEAAYHVHRGAIYQEMRKRYQWNMRGCFASHSDATNLLPSETVEVRVGRSTRKACDLLASVGLVTASVDYVRSMQPWNATKQATQWETFTEWTANSDVYSFLTPLIATDAYTNPSLF